VKKVIAKKFGKLNNLQNSISGHIFAGDGEFVAVWVVVVVEF
jgi:hypothetical protein